MKLITWIVALYNRKWQRKLDTMMSQLEEVVEFQRNNKIVCGYSVKDRSIPTKEEVLEVIDNQPTHLSHKFRARAKRKKHYSKPKPSTKEEAYQETINEEFKRMAQGR